MHHRLEVLGDVVPADISRSALGDCEYDVAAKRVGTRVCSQGEFRAMVWTELQASWIQTTAAADVRIGRPRGGYTRAELRASFESGGVGHCASPGGLQAVCLSSILSSGMLRDE